MDLVTLAAGAATLLSTWQLVPQVHKTRKVDSIEGLSMIWAVVGVALNLGWVGYRWSQELWVGLLSPVAASVFYLVLFVMIVGARRKDTIAVLGSTAAFAAVVGSAVVGGWIAVGVLLGAGSVVHVWPSVWAAFRSPNPHGVSAGMWAIGLGQAILWGVYGWGSGDSIHLLYGVATAPGAAAILGRCAYVRRRALANPQASAAEPSMATA